MLPLLLGSVLATAVSSSFAATPGAPPLDWAAAGDETARLLADYLRVDTLNPPGNEERGADFLADLLAREGIPSEKVVHAPGRASLIARLEGSGAEPPLCLMHHIDVASAEPSRWPADRGPLSGALDADGYLWGRGALDTKGLGAVEVMAMVQAKRLGVPLKRDVILLAVADEEVGNVGMRELIAKKWPEIGCSHVLNEGGIGIRDLLFPRQTVYGISVAEKGLLWVRMVATGEAGHGSRPDAAQAPQRLAEAIRRIQRYRPRPRMHGSLATLFRNVAETRRGLVRFALRNPALVRPRLMAESGGRALLTDTINITGFNGGLEPNVVPSEVSANLDCRLLPGTTPADMLLRLRAIVPDEHVRFEVIDEADASESPTDDPFFRALARHAVAGRTDAVAGPALSVGFTDSLLLRPLGVRAYGLAPFEVTVEEAETMHGHGERVSVANLRRGLQVVLGAVLEVSAADPWDAAAVVGG